MNEQIYAYNLAYKRLFVFRGAVALGILLGIFLTLFFLRDAQINGLIWIYSIISHVQLNITQMTALGSLYTAFFGGLFFVFLPLEVIFVSFLSKMNPVLLVIIFVGSLMTAFYINYLVGSHFGEIAKKVITPKKFYALKGRLNRHGVLAIFLFNVLPLPSPPFMAILGVFRYNLKKMYLYAFLGQTIKFTLLAIAGMQLLSLFSWLRSVFGW